MIIDEIQYAPQLLNYIKIYVDNTEVNGSIWLAGTQRLPVMQGVTEILAERVGIIDLKGLTINEINNVANSEPFLPIFEQITKRLNIVKKQRKIFINLSVMVVCPLCIMVKKLAKLLRKLCSNHNFTGYYENSAS